jgi:hypothetical protein
MSCLFRGKKTLKFKVQNTLHVYCFESTLLQGCQIFLGKKYQNGENIPKETKNVPNYP